MLVVRPYLVCLEANKQINRIRLNSIHRKCHNSVILTMELYVALCFNLMAQHAQTHIHITKIHMFIRDMKGNFTISCEWFFCDVVPLIQPHKLWKNYKKQRQYVICIAK